jgi:hypothetical protein
MTDKYQHVARARQTRPHTCHWPGCDKQVPPAMWGCKEHWMCLLSQLRRAIWSAYRPGQEEDGAVSEEYLRVAREAKDFIIRSST